MLLRKLPNKGLRDLLVLQEHTMRTNHHALLAPREHNVRPSLVLHESRARSPDDRDDDVVFFVALKGVDIEYGVLPNETRGFQGTLDRVALGVVGSDDLEFLSVFNVTLGHSDDGFHLSFVLSGYTSAQMMI